jgi:hypothetical protein
MKHITKIAVVENATSIWEYDPSRDDNRVLGGSLDVIAAIRTLAIKVCFYVSHLLFSYSYHNRFRHPDSASRNSRILRYVVDFLMTLKIPLHSNIRWGTAYKMLDQANSLRQVFLT